MLGRGRGALAVKSSSCACFKRSTRVSGHRWALAGRRLPRPLWRAESKSRSEISRGNWDQIQESGVRTALSLWGRRSSLVPLTVLQEHFSPLVQHMEVRAP